MSGALGLVTGLVDGIRGLNRRRKWLRRVRDLMAASRAVADRAQKARTRTKANAILAEFVAQLDATEADWFPQGRGPSRKRRG